MFSDCARGSGGGVRAVVAITTSRETEQAAKCLHISNLILVGILFILHLRLQIKVGKVFNASMTGNLSIHTFPHSLTNYVNSVARYFRATSTSVLIHFCSGQYAAK